MLLQENFNFNKSHIIKNKYKENVLSCPQGTVPVLKQKNGTEIIHLNTVEYPGQHVIFLFFILSKFYLIANNFYIFMFLPF